MAFVKFSALACFYRILLKQYVSAYFTRAAHFLHGMTFKYKMFAVKN